MAGPSEEEFAALVAELRAEIATLSRPEAEAVRRHVTRPACVVRCPWAAQSILLADAARLTGYSQDTLRQYRSRPEFRHVCFPPTLTPERKICFRFAAGDIAVWFAFRDPSRCPRFGVRERQWAPPRAGGRLGRRVSRRKEMTAVIVRAVADKPTLTLEEAREACAGAGLPTAVSLPLMDRARAAALPQILARFASPRPDGLVRLSEVGEVFGIPYYRIKCSVADRGAARGTIRAVQDGYLWWTDPTRLRFRSEKSRRRSRCRLPAVPVDKDDPRAVPLPGEEAGRDAA
jgi:hypothetical protein